MPNGLHTLLKMNSLNILSSRVSPSSSPAPSRSNSIGSIGLAVHAELDTREGQGEGTSSTSGGDEATSPQEEEKDDAHGQANGKDCADEHTPLLGDCKELGPRSASWHLIPRRIAASLINSIRWIFSTLAAPGVYLLSFFYDESGNFSPIFPLRRMFGKYAGKPHKLASNYPETAMEEKTPGAVDMLRPAADVLRPAADGTSGTRRSVSSGSSSSGLSSESESDATKNVSGKAKGPSRGHSKSKSLADSEEIAPARRSIRIKLHNEDALRQRRHRKNQSSSSKKLGDSSTPDISAQLKSPTSPVSALTKYPKTPAPPRPLIPRRQPSYLNLVEPSSPKHQKTLILDLDETLIHSMSKGGRMSTGHMVEVRLNTTLVAAGGQTSIGPQHPILYYVHKRPHCDDFLRRVAKWYKLVIFTASVQEYADPVIDWLEQERKFFSGRYYRQHCTFRQGAFIKDLSSVEPDLSKVMILDNSPLSYLFHQDNAIPIQGWINDPTDNDLMHLVPFLEGLQYVTDVRALLALRGGEDGQHMA